MAVVLVLLILNSILVSGICRKKKILAVLFVFSCMSLDFPSPWPLTPAGSSRHNEVKQTPADVLGFPGGTVVISCSHNIKNYDRINWYRQSDRELQLLGYMNFNTGSPTEGLGVKLNGSALQGMTCNLTVEWLNANSSAVYYCASSLHTDVYSRSPAQKPQAAACGGLVACFQSQVGGLQLGMM